MLPVCCFVAAVGCYLFVGLLLLLVFVVVVLYSTSVLHGYLLSLLCSTRFMAFLFCLFLFLSFVPAVFY